jgi:peptidyl-prolyl cis-trans isomerase A (cyclophilin A)
MAVDDKEQYAMSDTNSAMLHTDRGDIRLVLFPQLAPATVRNFVGLVEGTRPYLDPRTRKRGTGPYYDGTIAHRVIAGFMVQMGDPLGTGRGWPGYQFADEFHTDLRFDKPYVLAMANDGPNTNGGQFFITVAPQPHLDAQFTIFGEVFDEESETVVDAIAGTPTDAQDKPISDVTIRRVVIMRG